MSQAERTGLFRIAQAANACGLSRSTILRMEESGLLTPAYIEPESGRRYYDNHNIARILQIENLKYMGFDKEEILSYFLHSGEATELLTILEKKLALLQRSVEEMRLRAGDSPHLSVDNIDLPEFVCCTRTHQGMTVAQKYDAMYSFYHDCVQRGLTLGREPLFTVNARTDYLHGQLTDAPYPFQVCIPVDAKNAPQDAVCFPACKALSVLYFGNYSGVDAAWLALGSEVKARGLTPAGHPRVLGIVAPYSGREIDPNRYCSRLVLPIA